MFMKKVKITSGHYVSYENNYNKKVIIYIYDNKVKGDYKWVN